MTDDERLARMSRKEIHAEIIHLSREQEEYEREIAYLKEQLEDRDRQIAELEHRIDRFQAAIGTECPIGDLDLITSLRAHKQHLMECISESQKQNAIMREALQKARSYIRGYAWGSSEAYEAVQAIDVALDQAGE
ncbi:hypothetical protein [Alicyclobacillus shizuokensis]|uniref:hypothetical protein n=1 Tax=Alicyclobacillus shizuokensis TaxID=392014 RepID=UPI000830A912|nr:hypothetical protein [Alicyclobacillus shizuokensis]